MNPIDSACPMESNNLIPLKWILFAQRDYRMAFDFDIRNALEGFDYPPDILYKTFLSADSCFCFDKSGPIVNTDVNIRPYGYLLLNFTQLKIEDWSMKGVIFWRFSKTMGSGSVWKLLRHPSLYGLKYAPI